MDHKKLIGTVLGVIAFVALIAGATFAWLSASVNVSNGTYQIKSKNFVINYAGSPTIENPIMLAQANTLISKMTTKSAASDTGDAWAAVTASKTANDAAASSFKLILNIDTNTISKNGVVYAVCKGACPATALISAINTSAATPTATCATGGTVVSCGVITKQSTASVVLYNDTTTFNTEADANATYNIYFWLDGPTIDNTNLGQEFAGYISASATQQ